MEYRDTDLIPRVQAYLRLLREHRVPDRVLSTAWDVFYERYDPVIVRLVGLTARREDELRERVQSVWLRLIVRLHKLDYDPRRGQFRDWLVPAVSRIVVSLRRSDRPHMETLNDARADRLQGREEDPVDAYERNQRCALVREALQSLPRRVSHVNSRILQLRVIEGWAARDVARAVGVPPSQLGYRQYRAAAALRAALVYHARRELLGDYVSGFF